MAVTKRTRYEVLKRDNHTCRYCGATAPDAKLTVDHVTPVALGGGDEPGNLVAACRDCNAGKSSTTPDASLVDEVKQLDLKWADAMRRAADILAVDEQPRNAYVMAFFEEWPSYRYLPADVDASVGRIFDAGLPQADMLQAARVATTSPGVHDRFAYFMGICWKRIKQMQEVAKQILEADATTTYAHCQHCDWDSAEHSETHTINCGCQGVR